MSTTVIANAAIESNLPVVLAIIIAVALVVWAVRELWNV